MDYPKAFDIVDHNKLWKILQEMGIPYHPTYLLRNLYAGQEGTVRLGTMDWFQIGKGAPESASCEMPGCMKLKLESREVSIASDMQMTPS